MGIALDEHLIKCSYCGRDLIVRDNMNDGVAFLSHLKRDHGIFYAHQKMTQTKVKEQRSKQMLDSSEERP
ncbi:hypothetical protein [Nitrososphaera sp.]|uniref:hypothetical protein n=1 Tax=Nitrososphaera sp. TaxID=1971748 RepID=UPI002ED9D99B